MKIHSNLDGISLKMLHILNTITMNAIHEKSERQPICVQHFRKIIRAY